MITYKQYIYNKVGEVRKQITLFSLFTIAFGMTLASCSEWDDHYDGGSAAGGSDASLWRQMSANPQLSDFCKVLEQTKVFRMHKKTPVSYAQLLDGGQLFTVVAPVNGSFNRDSLLAMLDTPQGDSIVEKSFIFNHLSRSATSLRSDSQTMLLLNSKHVAVGGNTIEGVAVVEANKHASNGVLHVASRPLPYEPNLYEALCDMPVMSAIGSLLRQYEEDYFDADASVSSGIVEGVPVYVDSVVIEYNKMLNAIGLLGAEDSLYWVVAPTADGWQRVWDKTSKYFEYDETVQKRDSIQQYWTMRALMDDAVFNMTDQSDVNKAIVSVPYLNWRKSASSGKPVYHRFVAPFEPGGVLYGAQPVQCSNGVLYQTQEWPFRATDTWFKEIWAEGESTWLITEDKNCTYNARREVADSISESAYLQVLPQTATSNWELTYRLNNTLSGDYDICLILLPKSVSNQNNPDKKPCKFKATLSYVDAKGITQTETFGNKQFTSKPERVDTVVLAERFHLPACNYDQSDIKVTLRLQCSILPRENTTYSREMYLDCIYLRPRE